MHESEKQPLTLEKTYNATPEDLWQALTDPVQMRAWYFPMLEDFRPVPGFVTEFTVIHPESANRYIHRWTVTEAIPLKKIAYDWKYPEYDGLGNVCFEVEAKNNQTSLKLTFSVKESFKPEVFPELSLSNFNQGWSYLVSALETHLLK